MKKKKKINWKVLIISLLIVYGIAYLGSLFTDTTGWYESVKPAITPPNYVFPIVWNILFFLIALSLYFAWIFGKQKRKIALVFAINLFLNVLWSFLFFYLKNPLAAFIELIVLWFSILAMIIVVKKVSKLSAWLLMPYLLWVGFAGILNWLIVVA